MGIGNEIKKIRKKCLMSQTDFANKLNVSFSTVNRWENNKNVPDYKTMNKIKDFCIKNNVSYDELLKLWEEIR